VTGNGHSHLNKLLGTLDSPGVSQTCFSAIDEQIGEWWKKVVDQEMLAAATEERKIAIEKGEYHGDVPCITVITDGVVVQTHA
jgi:hypothetical protein